MKEKTKPEDARGVFFREMMVECMRSVVVLLIWSVCCVGMSYGQGVREEDGGEGNVFRAKQEAREAERARVVVVEDKKLVSHFVVDEERLREAFRQAMVAYGREGSLAGVWGKFVEPGERVGIKVNTAGGGVLRTQQVLIDEVVAGLLAAGVEARDITIWDKQADDMREAGFKSVDAKVGGEVRGMGGVVVRSVMPGSGYDGDVRFFHEVAGRLIWGDYEFVGKRSLNVIDLFKDDGNENGKDVVTDMFAKKNKLEQRGNHSYYAKLVTQEFDKIINMPVLSDHAGMGVYGCLSSLAVASVDNSRRFSAGGSSAAARGVSDIWIGRGKGGLKEKVVLNIMDGVIAQFAGGPEFEANYAYSAGLLLISADPVAVDMMALSRIESWRQERDVVAVGKNGFHVKEAAKFGIGINDPERISVVVLEAK